MFPHGHAGWVNERFGSVVRATVSDKRHSNISNLMCKSAAVDCMKAGQGYKVISECCDIDQPTVKHTI